MKKFWTVALTLVVLLSVAGCGVESGPPTPESTSGVTEEPTQATPTPTPEPTPSMAEEPTQATPTPTPEPTPSMTKEPTQAPTQPSTPTPTPTPPKVDIFPRNFSFSSGAGGWSTELNVAKDGSFSGSYHDSDMGDVGPGYPGGTVYLCNFSGKFSAPKKVNDYTYSVRLETLKQEGEPGAERIEDSIRWIISTAYGVEDGEEFLIYLPGAPVEKLPEPFVQWTTYGYYPWNAKSLPDYGLYNVAQELGFSSYSE